MNSLRLHSLPSRPNEPAGLAPTAATLFELATFAPRVLVHLAAVAALSGFIYGCVPAKQYEKAETAAREQAEARKQLMVKLQQAEQRAAMLSVELDRKHQALEHEQSTLDASKLETTVALKDREAAQELVMQLRSDLARAGDHLAWFSTEKRDLGKALLLAEQRMDDVEHASQKLVELVGMSRDLSLLLGENQSMGDLVLGSKDGVVLLEVPESRLFAAGVDALVVDAAPVLAGVARASGAHEPLKIEIRAPGGSELDKARATRLSEALAERGIARARIALDVPNAPAAVTPVPAPAPAADEATEPVAAPVAEPAPPAVPKNYVIAFVP